jgi:hypothetical protein
MIGPCALEDWGSASLDDCQPAMCWRPLPLGWPHSFFHPGGCSASARSGSAIPKQSFLRYLFPLPRLVMRGVRRFRSVLGIRRQGLIFLQCNVVRLPQPLLLTIIKLLKVVTLLSWGRFSYARARPRSSVPHPPKMLTRSGSSFPR